MMKFASWSCAALALAGVGALVTTAPADAAGKKVCYAFQDLSTGFWGAGHEAIVSTLQKNDIEVVELNGGKDANRQLEQIKDCIAQVAALFEGGEVSATGAIDVCKVKLVRLIE